MSTHDIELPPLPVPRTKTDGGIELFAEYSVREYARAAIKPYQKRIEELEAQLEAVGAGGVSSQQITSPSRGEPVAWPEKPPKRKGQSHVLFDDGYDEGWAKCLEECKAAAQHAIQPTEPAISDRQILLKLMEAFDTETWQCPSCGHAEETATMDSAYMLRDYLKETPAAEPARVPSEDERAAQGLPPYNPRKPTEEEWRRLTENGRRAWGNHPAVPEKEPPCDT